MNNFEKFVTDPNNRNTLKQYISRGMECSSCPMYHKRCEGFGQLDSLEACDAIIGEWLEESV